MRHCFNALFLLIITSAFAEDMIDNNLITPIECTKPAVIIEHTVEIKPEIKINKITNFGYSSNRSFYSLNTVHVGTYVLVDIDGILYRKYLLFANNRWTEILIKD